MGGFEERFSIRLNERFIKGKAELDVDRTTADGKASSVQFIHFVFTDEDIRAFKDEKSKIELAINHETYAHSTTLQKSTINELIGDFN